MKSRIGSLSSSLPWPVSLLVSFGMALVVLTLSFSAHAIDWPDIEWPSCKTAKQSCSLISWCCGDLECEFFAWGDECRHDPPLEGEVCTIFSGCAGSDLYCKGFQDGLAGRCTQYSKLGETCDGIITLCGDRLACTQDARYPNVVSNPGKGRCYPGGAALWPWNDDEACLASYSETIHKDLPVGTGQYSSTPIDAVRAMTFGSGGAASIVAGWSFEKGGVYGYDGTYGCYQSYCYMWEGNAEFSAFSTIGQYETYEDASSDGYEAFAGAGIIFGASRATAWDLQPDDVSAAIVGDVFGVSFGLDVVPITGGVAYCTTEVNEVIKDWQVITGPRAKCADREACADSVSCDAHASINNDSEGDAPLTITQSPAGPYSIGSHDVTLDVQDSAGDTDQCQGVIDILDCHAPAITCPATKFVECEANLQAHVVPDAANSSDCSEFNIENPLAGSYPLGVTDVEYIATDSYENASACTSQIKVVDTTPPVVTGISTNPAVLWPPNHKMRTVLVDVQVEDACDNLAPVCEITDVTVYGWDVTKGRWWYRPDAKIVAPLTVQLRAERFWWPKGREYVIGVLCADITGGNSARSTVNVSVPHRDPRNQDKNNQHNHGSDENGRGNDTGGDLDKKDAKRKHDAGKKPRENAKHKS